MKNKIQNYAWGTMGKNAFIPRLLGLDPQINKPYAELWMGAHPSAPSDILIGRTWVPLNKLIDDFPHEILGTSMGAQGASTKFPFLLKVLSIAEPLSIQAHPNRVQAKILHGQDPINYPDENHKPEIAIALDSLTAFLGFKDYDQLVDTLEEYPELKVLTQDQNPKDKTGTDSSVEKSEAILRAICNSLIHISLQEGYLSSLIARIEKRIEKSGARNETEDIFLRLTNKYPGDVGLLFLFLLNLVQIQQGEAIFTSPGILHAYVNGNIVECMATSDNVVRAGLTPKYKDLKTLANIISYAPHNIHVSAHPIDPFETVYDTVAEEFRISVIKLNKYRKIDSCPGNSPEILLITKGNIQIRWREKYQLKQQEFHQGNSILIPAFLNSYTIVAQTASNIFKAKAPTPNRSGEFNIKLQ
ncbi:MAG: mannose-6-phosphate isomerase, class I [Anaerolineales bacterium]|jgi:mannose-6-phosphate isomerase